MKKVIVTHPTRQHSPQLALALHKRNALGGYWSGYPSVYRHHSIIPAALWKRAFKYPDIEIPEKAAKWDAFSLILNRATLRFYKDKVWGSFRGDRRFDRWASSQIRRMREGRADLLIAYEMAALESFLEAKKKGLKVILDAASLHCEVQDQLMPFSTSALSAHQKINAHKKKEIALADHILTASVLARDSYVRAGVSGDKVTAVSLGVDTDFFSPSQSPKASERNFRFLFVGRISATKGSDFLFKSFEQVCRDIPGTQLRCVGQTAKGNDLANVQGRNIFFRGQLSPRELLKEYHNADCLVLPSRFDSFGMVVTEALACGIPVILSDKVGAKDVIEEGENGWVIPMGDDEALAERMIWAVKNKEYIRAMTQVCRSAVLNRSWANYHEEAAGTIEKILQQSKP